MLYGICVDYFRTKYPRKPILVALVKGTRATEAGQLVRSSRSTAKVVRHVKFGEESTYAEVVPAASQENKLLQFLRCDAHDSTRIDATNMLHMLCI